MGRFGRRSNANYVLQLRRGAEAEAALHRTPRAYAEAPAWLDAEIPATPSGDLVRLHRAWYCRLWGLGPVGWEFRIVVAVAVLKGDAVMATEGVFARVGRVVAGMAHAAVLAAEQSNPAAVLEQAIREIDGAADEVRTELGKATAERH